MRILILLAILTLASCGYHLRQSPALAKNYPQIQLQTQGYSELKHQLSTVLVSSGIELVDDAEAARLTISKDSLVKLVQSVGANNQVQEYRLEYDVEFSFAGGKTQSIHLERDYSFDIQQIGGGQQEELNIRRQLTEDMAWTILRRINVTPKP